MAVKRIFAASARQDHIISERIAKNTKSLKRLANAGSVLRKSFSLLHPLNLHSEMYADDKNALS